MSTSPRLFGRLGVALVAALVLLQLQASAATTGRVSRPLAERVQVGAYVDGMQDDPARLAAWEAEVGGRAEIASYYYGYGDVFPARTERVFADGGNRKVLLSWDMGPTRFTEWSAGDHDAYLDQIAAAARAYPHEAYVRPWPEMNGDWQTFQPTRTASACTAGPTRSSGRPGATS